METQAAGITLTLSLGGIYGPTRAEHANSGIARPPSASDCSADEGTSSGKDDQGRTAGQGGGEGPKDAPHEQGTHGARGESRTRQHAAPLSHHLQTFHGREGEDGRCPGGAGGREDAESVRGAGWPPEVGAAGETRLLGLTRRGRGVGRARAKDCGKRKGRGSGRSSEGGGAVRSTSPLRKSAMDWHRFGPNGYTWKKYSHKMLSTAAIKRYYYECTTGGCTAKKVVDRSARARMGDYSTDRVSMEGSHNHPRPLPPPLENVIEAPAAPSCEGSPEKDNPCNQLLPWLHLTDSSPRAAHGQGSPTDKEQNSLAALDEGDASACRAASCSEGAALQVLTVKP